YSSSPHAARLQFAVEQTLPSRERRNLEEKKAERLIASESGARGEESQGPPASRRLRVRARPPMPRPHCSRAASCLGGLIAAIFAPARRESPHAASRPRTVPAR